MSARDRILGRIASKLAASEPLDIEAHIQSHPRGPAPEMKQDIATCFKERAGKLSSDVIEVARLDEVPVAAATYLRERNLPMQAVCWPQFDSLDWNAAGLIVEDRKITGQDLVGITGIFCAIAETGTLMLLSGPDTPASMSLLPETHVAILPADRIVQSMEDAWALLRKEKGQLPRAVNFVSGPSRTADIEQTVTLGAHGPYRVLIVLVGAI